MLSFSRPFASDFGGFRITAKIQPCSRRLVLAPKEDGVNFSGYICEKNESACVASCCLLFLFSLHFLLLLFFALAATTVDGLMHSRLETRCRN
jgi:hypothetical protein